MALTALLDVKQSPVRRFMERELPATAPVCKEANASVRAGRSGDPPGAPGPGVDGGLVGTAVEYVLPIPHGSVRKPQLAGAPTPELADRRLEAAELAVAELRRLGGLAEPLSGPALERAADCALVCARLEQRFRIGDNRGYELRLPDPAVGVGVVGGLDGAIEAALASAETRADLVALLEAGLTDTADLYSADALAIDPSFALRAYAGRAAASLAVCAFLKAIRPLASWRSARWFSSFFDQRMRIPRLRFSQEWLASTTQRLARQPGVRIFSAISSPRARMCAVNSYPATRSRTSLLS
jgi:hypothetical protein